MSVADTWKRNKWRYLSLIAGFFLFVGPFALIARGVNFLTGNLADPTTHTLCYRMPIDWVFGGRFLALFGSVAAAFILGVIVLSFFAGAGLLRVALPGWFCE